MSEPDTLEFIAQRRKSLHQLKSAAKARLDQAKNELAALEREERALTALGRALKAEPSAPRTPSGEIRKAILAAVASRPEGLTAAEIIDTLDARGNKSRQDAIRNALHAMKQPRGQRVPELGHGNGRYSVPSTATSESTSATDAPKAG